MFKKLFAGRFSNQTAKNRLQMVLVQDRAGMSAKDMECFKKDLMEVISRYFVIDSRSLQIEWERNHSQTALVINTAIKGKSSADARPPQVGEDVVIDSDMAKAEAVG